MKRYIRDSYRRYTSIQYRGQKTERLQYIDRKYSIVVKTQKDMLGSIYSEDDAGVCMVYQITKKGIRCSKHKKISK
jgi:hypothetical protein